MDIHGEKRIIGSKANDSKSVVSDTVGNSEGQRALPIDILLYTNWRQLGHEPTFGNWVLMHNDKNTYRLGHFPVHLNILANCKLRKNNMSLPLSSNRFPGEDFELQSLTELSTKLLLGSMQEIPKSTLQICAHIWKKLCHESQVPKFSYEKE